MAINNGSNISHARYCANRNVKSSVLFIALCGMGTALSWRSMHHPLAASAVSTFGMLVALVILVQVFFSSKCIRERLVAGIVMIVLGIGYLDAVAVARVGHGVGALEVSRPILWTVATLISLTMLISSIRTHREA
jgi:hypothetical protein